MIALQEFEKHDVCELAIAALRKEHDSLRTVVALLERLVRDIAAFKSEPDFGLICSAVYYIDDFPERMHHPKENEHIFARLRARTAAFDCELDRLQAEHVQSGNLVTSIERAIVRYQGGSPDGLHNMRLALAAYSTLLRGHMRAEERLLEAARDHFSDADWLAIATAFETDPDPSSPHSSRTEFRRLHARIINMLPRKMRPYSDK